MYTSAVTMWEGERFYFPVTFTFPHSHFQMMTHKRKKPLKLRETERDIQSQSVAESVFLCFAAEVSAFPLIPSTAAEGLPRRAEG